MGDVECVGVIACGLCVGNQRWECVWLECMRDYIRAIGNVYIYVWWWYEYV